jgi:cytochrome P450
MDQTIADHHFLRLNEQLLRDPYPFFHLLRAQQAPVQEPDYGVYLVSRYHDVVEVLRQPEAFSSVLVATAPYVDLPCPVDDLARWRAEHPFGDKILSNDPPDHTRHKKLINRFFTPRRVAELEPRIRAITDEIIDSFVDRGEVEFVTEFAHMLPRLVVGELIGVPQEDNARFKEFFGKRLEVMAETAADPVAGFARRTGEENEGITEDQFLREYFVRAITERRNRPSGDIMSDLAAARFPDGEQLPVESIVSMIALLYAAGGDANTPELMTNSMLVLLRHPDVMESLRADRSLIEPFIEEVLRFDNPVLGDFRVATRDMTVAGVPIPKGAKLMVLFSSANHDESQFADPDRFDLYREARMTHLSFGHGAHFCPGASLARLEGRIAVEHLLARLDNIRMADDAPVPYVPSVIQRIPIRVPLRFDAVGAFHEGGVR